jgi:hypothetical protein
MFGLLGASSVAVISNGFLQIMESLAMACPVLCIDRGVGLWAWLVDDRFKGVVSIGQSLSEQSQRLRKWVAHPPIDAELRDALQTERNGCRLSAELIEQVVAHVA